MIVRSSARSSSTRGPAFSRIAEVLGVSEQTVARRYRRLRGDGYLRVMGLVSPRGLGVTEWLLRIGCRPGGARRLADALARREDVSWVTLSSGGSEIVCVVRSLSEQQSDELLLQRLPATSQVLSLATHAVLHRFAGPQADWAGYGGRSDRRTGHPAGRPAGRAAGRAEPADPDLLQPSDAPLLAALALDGRTSYAALASRPAGPRAGSSAGWRRCARPGSCTSTWTWPPRRWASRPRPTCG